MTKSESYIAFILSELRKGNVERGKVLAKFVKKWQTSDRTFDRYFKITNERHTVSQQAIEKEKESISAQMELEAHKDGVLTKLEKQKILAEIASGNARVQEKLVKYNAKGEPELEFFYREPTAFERLKAVEIDNKMAGDNAPVKQENKIIVEQPLFDDNDVNDTPSDEES
jgi:hypothetical protein